MFVNRPYVKEENCEMGLRNAWAVVGKNFRLNTVKTGVGGEST